MNQSAPIMKNILIISLCLILVGHLYYFHGLTEENRHSIAKVEKLEADVNAAWSAMSELRRELLDFKIEVKSMNLKLRSEMMRERKERQKDVVRADIL